MLPLNQDCPDGEACIDDPDGDGFICVLDASDGMAPEGTPCEYANVCDPGLICVDPALYPSPACALEEGCCAPFCDLNLGDDDCQGLSVGDAVCVAYHEPGSAPSGFENVGVCGAA